MNLVLRQMEKLLFASSTFSLEDVVEGDIMAICSYFAAFFMQTYKFLQSQAVVTRLVSVINLAATASLVNVFKLYIVIRSR